MVRSPENWQEYNFAVVGEELVEHVAHAIDHYRQTTMPEYHTPRNYAKAAIAAMDKDGEVERLREALNDAHGALCCVVHVRVVDYALLQGTIDRVNEALNPKEQQS